MFVTTFYSYKGGVGRTMALANVASELSLRGKSVLVADFDLEAPGLSSFAFNGCEVRADGTPGLIEFVHHWIDHGCTPNILDYVCRHDDGDDPSRGAIFVMPAGRIDDNYGARLRQIDFDTLYREREGYLLFEDIRAQWEKILKVDYVLIDSRTGHTDIGGICTRQLPDLIAFVFWPNIQNLNGLSSISKEMEEQGQESGRTVEKLYVPSNLPLLDDEGDVLRGLLARFRSTLAYDSNDEVRIHNYSSLDLLEQKIFTRERPKSRLAREYRNLADAITSQNLEDADGVKNFLQTSIGNRPSGMRIRPTKPVSKSSRRAELRLQQIISMHWDDSEINRLLAMAKAREGELLSAVRMIELVIARGDDSLNDHLWLAQWVAAAGMPVDPKATVNRLLDDDESTQAHVIAALRLIMMSQSPTPDNLERRPALLRLSPQQFGRIAETFQSSKKQVRLVGRIISSALNRDRAGFNKAFGGSAISLALVLIGGGYFADALSLLNPMSTDKTSQKMRIVFNSAMAGWGMNGEPPTQLFEEVIKLHAEIDAGPNRGANYDQCIGLAMAVVGRKDEALEMLSSARTLVERQTTSFSCWSYLERGELSFADDIDEMRLWITKGVPVPDVFRDVEAATFRS